jgi:glycosyltransferase involved in cell wall biosynthesis
VPDRPLVSVVTPTLNQAQFLEPTLRSVRKQSYPRIEHIVVDGGSIDGTLEILRSAGSERGSSDDGVLRWQTGPDRGMYDAVNKGLELAHGEILAYLNSDDAWLPWAVEAATRVFEANPRVDLVFGDGIKLHEEDGAQRLRLFPPFDRVSLANYESLMQPAVFWRRRLTERIGGFETGMRYVADLDYWLRAAEAGARIEHLSEVVAIERIHAGRLSSAQSAAMALEDKGMRAGHAGDRGGAAGRKRAVDRDIRWQRWLWFRFVLAASFRSLPGPWHRFLRNGAVKVRRRRALKGSRPYQNKQLRNAVISGVAADALAGRTEA